MKDKTAPAKPAEMKNQTIGGMEAQHVFGMDAPAPPAQHYGYGKCMGPPEVPAPPAPVVRCNGAKCDDGYRCDCMTRQPTTPAPEGKDEIFWIKKSVMAEIVEAKDAEIAALKKDLEKTTLAWAIAADERDANTLRAEKAEAYVVVLEKLLAEDRAIRVKAEAELLSKALAIVALRAERDRLREAIEKAPHGDICDCDEDGTPRMGGCNGCDCWKAAVLAEGEGK